MSLSAEIYWATTGSPDEAARTLARTLPDARLRYAGDAPTVPLVYRQRPGRPEWIGGDVDRNHPGQPLDGEAVDDPQWQAAIDPYPIVWTLRRHPRVEHELRREAGEIFEELAALVSDPLLLTFDLDLLVAARLPGEPVTRFPAGTTPYAEHLDVWRRYRIAPVG